MARDGAVIGYFPTAVAGLLALGRLGWACGSFPPGELTLVGLRAIWELVCFAYIRANFGKMSGYRQVRAGPL